MGSRTATITRIVTFLSYWASLPPWQAVKGNQLGGTFALELDGYVTEDLPYDATAEEVDAALEDLGNVGIVSVSRCGTFSISGWVNVKVNVVLGRGDVVIEGNNTHQILRICPC